MKHFIYADNAATTKLDIDAFEAMKPFLLEDYGMFRSLILLRVSRKELLQKQER